jgi:penicillin-binding protein 2
MGFPESLEVSCDTFYYKLGWDMQQQSGVTGYEGVSPQTQGEWGRHNQLHLPNNVQRFQRYARIAGLGHTTGIDLPAESAGLIPDQKWCHDSYLATIKYSTPTCNYGWLPGYAVNMAIGQGDVLATPLQMAVTYSAIANGGKVFAPRVGMKIARPKGKSEQTVKDIKAPVVGHLPLDDTELNVIRQGLGLVITGSTGTAHSTFQGYPESSYPIAGKTGTAQLPGTTQNDAWFMSYGPTTNPRYVVAVEVQKAGFGAVSAAPISRQIWEAIFHIDKTARVHSLGSGGSG